MRIDTVLSSRDRYIQGYDGLVSSILYEYDCTDITSLTSIHIDDISVKVGDEYVNVSEQTVSVSGTLGSNYYIMVDSSGTISVSTTRTDSTSYTCIGGFHYGVVRKSTTISNVSNGIVPNSIWTLKWLPDCNSPDAMVYIGNKLWGDIYLTRCKSSCTDATYGIGGEVYESSAYGSVPATGTEGFNKYAFIEALMKVGKELPSYDLYVKAANGSPSGLDSSNTNAWTATTNTARTSCGAVTYAVSSLNIRDLVGNVWKWNSDNYELDRGNTTAQTYTWIETWSDVGLGDVYGANTYGIGSLLSGGRWINGSHCGSRSVLLSGWPWSVSTYNGAWAVAHAR